MKKSMTRLATLGALALAIAVLPGVPASAATTTTAPSGCVSGQFCAYQYVSWGGASWRWTGDGTNWNNKISTSGVAAAKQATSWFNNGVPCAGCDRVWLFDQPYIQGNLVDCLGPGTGDNNLTGDWRDNRVQSHNWASYCSY